MTAAGITDQSTLGAPVLASIEQDQPLDDLYHC
jgi:hypothetical protein